MSAASATTRGLTVSSVRPTASPAAAVNCQGGGGVSHVNCLGRPYWAWSGLLKTILFLVYACQALSSAWDYRHYLHDSALVPLQPKESGSNGAAPKLTREFIATDSTAPPKFTRKFIVCLAYLLCTSGRAPHVHPRPRMRAWSGVGQVHRRLAVQPLRRWLDVRSPPCVHVELCTPNVCARLSPAFTFQSLVVFVLTPVFDGLRLRRSLAALYTNGACVCRVGYAHSMPAQRRDAGRWLLASSILVGPLHPAPRGRGVGPTAVWVPC